MLARQPPRISSSQASMGQSPSKKRRKVYDADAAKKDKAKKFHQAIMADFVDIGVDVDVGNLIKGVMRSVPDRIARLSLEILLFARMIILSGTK